MYFLVEQNWHVEVVISVMTELTAVQEVMVMMHPLYVIVFTSRLAVFPSVTQKAPPRSTSIPYPWNATRPINCWITSRALTSNLVGSL